MTQTVGDFFWDRLGQWGVTTIFGYTGDGINGLHGALQRTVDADGRSGDIQNLWLCDGSVFPTVGGVNPSLTIQAIALRTGDWIRALAERGEL